MAERIVALIDMDCFYCQVESRINPSLKGKPMAVVQYNTWKGGGIIAVNYEARDFGVTRHLRGNEAKQKCPEIVLVQVPEVRGKADLTKYRDAGREVVNVLSQFSNCVERASVDEAYIDLTQTVEKYIQKMDTTVTTEQLPNTFVVGYSEEDNNDEDQRLAGLGTWLAEQMVDPIRLKLAVAGLIVEEIRAAIFKQTEFRCSAGIGHNKVLSKLVCGLHKPNRQTILPQSSVAELYRTMSVKKVRHLGGKLGDSVVELLGCKVMADLDQFTEAQLQAKFDTKNGSWLYNIARGVDHEPVTPRLLAKSIGCCKAFKGTQALVTRTSVEKWTSDLAKELAERLVKEQEENKRNPKLLTVSFILEDASMTRSASFNAYDAERITSDAMELIRRSNGDKWHVPIKYLGLSAGKFADESSNQNSIQSFFKTVDKMSDEYKEQSNLKDTGDTGDQPVTKDKEQPHSFFMKYFKKQMVGKQSNATSNEQHFPPSTSKDTQSNCHDGGADLMQISRGNSEINDDKILHKEPRPSCIEEDILNPDSSSNDSVLWTSLGEIFPDINSVDNEVAALLPSQMQKQLAERRKEKNAQMDEIKKVKSGKTHLSSDLKNGELHSEVDEEEVIGSDMDLFENSVSGESTDVDSDVVCVAVVPSPNKTKSKSVSRDPIPSTSKTNASTSENNRSTSNLESNNTPGQLCSVCSKHILLHEYLEHLDFHAAQDLHQQLNSAPAAVVSNRTAVASAKVEKNTSASIGGKKRGRPPKSAASKNDKKLRSITSFFTSTK